jgi:uncharacterized protein (TIGR02001 family)
MKHLPKLMLALVALSTTAFAEESKDETSFNVGVVSQYRYRGIGQSRGKPALQGGADFSSATGFYVGTWGSTIDWIKDSSTSTTAVKGPLELDFYGGYKFQAGDLDMDVGYLRYQYAGNNLANLGSPSVNANTNEIYGALTAGLFTAKYSYSTGNLFGNENTKGSSYLEASINFDLGNGYSLVPHVGHQKVANFTPSLSYTDAALTLNKDLGAGLSVSLSGLTTNAKQNATATPTAYYFPSQPSYNPTKSTAVLGLKYTF